MKQLRLAFQLELDITAELEAELRRAEEDLVGRAFGRHGHHHAVEHESTRGESPYEPSQAAPADPSEGPDTSPAPDPSQAERGTRSPSKAKPRNPTDWTLTNEQRRASVMARLARNRKADT